MGSFLTLADILRPCLHLCMANTQPAIPFEMVCAPLLLLLGGWAYFIPHTAQRTAHLTPAVPAHLTQALFAKTAKKEDSERRASGGVGGM